MESRGCHVPSGRFVGTPPTNQTLRILAARQGSTVRRAHRLHLAFAAVPAVFYFLPHPAMTMYRIRYSIYRINASDANEAKRKVVELMQKRPQDWISVEQDRPRRGFWKTMLLG